MIESVELDIKRQEIKAAILGAFQCLSVGDRLDDLLAWIREDAMNGGEQSFSKSSAIVRKAREALGPERETIVDEKALEWHRFCAEMCRVVDWSKDPFKDPLTDRAGAIEQVGEIDAIFAFSDGAEGIFGEGCPDDVTFMLSKSAVMSRGWPAKRVLVAISNVSPKKVYVAGHVTDGFITGMNDVLLSSREGSTAVRNAMAQVYLAFEAHRAESQDRDALKEALELAVSCLRDHDAVAKVRDLVDRLMADLKRMDEAFHWASTGDFKSSSSDIGVGAVAVKAFLDSNAVWGVAVLVDDERGSVIRKDVEYFNGEIRRVIVIGSSASATDGVKRTR